MLLLSVFVHFNYIDNTCATMYQHVCYHNPAKIHPYLPPSQLTSDFWLWPFNCWLEAPDSCRTAS